MHLWKKLKVRWKARSEPARTVDGEPTKNAPRATLFDRTFSHYWGELDDEIRERMERLRGGVQSLKTFKRSNAFQLAATELFVEKAQIHLTVTAQYFIRRGILLASAAFAILIIIIVAIYFAQIPDKPTWQTVVLFALRSAGFAGFSGAAVYFMVSLSRAFLHEATVLLNRRHALRFGRLYVYLKYGESTDERELLLDLLKKQKDLRGDVRALLPAVPADTEKTVASNGDAAIATPAATGDGNFELPPIHADLIAYLIHRDVRAEDLERAFGWNLQMHTGFRDIKAETMATSIYSRALDVLSKVVERLGKAKSGEAEEK